MRFSYSGSPPEKHKVMRCVPIGHFASGHCPHINLGRSRSDSGPMNVSNDLVIHYQEVKSTANKKVYSMQNRVVCQI